MPSDANSRKSTHRQIDSAKQGGWTMPDFGSLDLYYESVDGSMVLAEYIEYVANKGLLRYKQKTQTGSKAGESLWTHVMNLVTTIEKLRFIFNLDADEMRCLLLALTAHDLNKLDEYGAGKNYANAASRESIWRELEQLNVVSFFPDWQEYRYDIAWINACSTGVGSIRTAWRGR